MVRVRISRLELLEDRSRRPALQFQQVSLDSTVAESVAVDSQDDKRSPRSSDRRLGASGLAGFDRGSWRSSMQTIGVLLLAAATAGDGFGYNKPDVGLKKWLRPHAVVSDGAPRRADRNIRPRPWAVARRRGHGSRRTPVRQYQEPDLFPRSRRHERRLADRHRTNGERTYLSTQLVVPARYNFNQGYIYRLKLSNIPGRQASASTRRSRSPRPPLRPTPTLLTTRSPSSSPPRTSTRSSTAATS